MTDVTPSSQYRRNSTRVPTTISLVGFMGAGKTTVGRALSGKLGWKFVDLDDLIQEQDGRTIPEIFQNSGEKAFRELERQLLRRFVGSSQANASVLSLGGGAFIDNTNQQLLRENGIPAVFLDASAEELFGRCQQPGVERPLLSDRNGFSALYDRRRPAYMNAEFCIQTAGREIASIVDEIMARLGLGP
ncbi:MAG TPA: shikimate kinase [Terriglobales bacterium]|nr:shikimate kinase [Terriglobales bacterium]HXF12485.1 shikimate kinase [Terriglobales bacterium]